MGACPSHASCRRTDFYAQNKFVFQTEASVQKLMCMDVVQNQRAVTFFFIKIIMLELILLLVLLFLYSFHSRELFGFVIPELNGYTDFPWNNTQIGTKNNMSYDIRGEAYNIPYRQVSPWNNPESTYVIHNPPLNI